MNHLITEPGFCQAMRVAQALRLKKQTGPVDCFRDDGENQLQAVFFESPEMPTVNVLPSDSKKPSSP